MRHHSKDTILDYDAVKPESYFAGARQDWIDRLPRGEGLHLLELGCGYGETAAYAFDQGVCETYHGIEIAPNAAAIAQTHMTGVVCGDAWTVRLPYKRNQFDGLLMSEVLEHLVDPWAVLARLLPLVKPGGWVFASSPNVAHKDIIKELVAGKWDLTEQGPKDRTHLRWFTPASYQTMFEEQGVKVEHVGPLNPQRSFKQKLLTFVAGQKYDHLFAYQINLIGRRGVRSS